MVFESISNDRSLRYKQRSHMKIGITGVNNGFREFYPNAKIVSLRDGIESCFAAIKDCDVFINYSHNRTDQSILFSKIFREWVDQPKTIINFGSSIVNEDGTPFPHYANDKKHLVNVARDTARSYPHKRVRVVNLNPSTLETNTSYPEYNKISFKALFDVVEFILNLDQSIEISDITVKRTTTKDKPTI